jgi:hypothetical protein
MLLALTAGCTHPVFERTPNGVTICGTTMATGARSAVILTLQPDASPAPPPPQPILPAAASPD